MSSVYKKPSSGDLFGTASFGGGGGGGFSGAAAAACGVTAGATASMAVSPLTKNPYGLAATAGMAVVSVAVCSIPS